MIVDLCDWCLDLYLCSQLHKFSLNMLECKRIQNVYGYYCYKSLIVCMNLCEREFYKICRYGVPLEKDCITLLLLFLHPPQQYMQKALVNDDNNIQPSTVEVWTSKKRSQPINFTTCATDLLRSTGIRENLMSPLQSVNILLMIAKAALGGP